MSVCVLFLTLSEGSEIKAYGAGLLSSFGELEYCLSDKPNKEPFDPTVTAGTKYPITEYQPTYFVTESFKRATQQMLEFAATLSRPFEVRYNPYTLSVEILDSKEKLANYAQNLSLDMANLARALNTL